MNSQQAGTRARQLANDKALSVYHCLPFRDSQQACFMNGHWVWSGMGGVGHGDIQATVELAADGSAGTVDLERIDSRDERSGRQY